MAIPVYTMLIVLAIIVLVVTVATGAFFSKPVGLTLGLTNAVISASGIFLAAVSGPLTILPVTFIALGVILLLLSVALALAALGGE